VIRAALAALAALALALPGAAAAQEASLTDIEDEVMCPICGTTLELSESPQAEREREFIRLRIEQGQSKEEIKDALVAEYGEDVLAVPDADGFDLTAWVVPALGIGLAALGVGLAIARLARRRDRDDAGPALEPEQDARIDRDMKSYDL
jgi:cytochrome c-type biogenesis protein CcmH/NrfF